MCDQNGIIQGDLGLLTSVVSKLKPNMQLQMWIFDCDSDQPFLERVNFVAKALCKAPANAFLHCIPQYTPFVCQKDHIREFIGPQIDRLNIATEGIVVRDAIAGYEQPNMYKMVFLRPKTQVRANVLKMKSDVKKALVRFVLPEDESLPDNGGEREIGFSKRAFEEFKELYASPLMSRDPEKQMVGVEVVVDLTKNCIVGLSTNWF